MFMHLTTNTGWKYRKQELKELEEGMDKSTILAGDLIPILSNR